MIPLFKVFMSKKVITLLEKVLYSGYIGEGPKVIEFEKQISKKLETPYVVALNSGTSGLHLAYQMIKNNEKNAEVIVSPMTCSATLTPILANNMKIVWADIDPISGNISIESILNKITKNTKAIVAMHWGGNPCDMIKINEIANKSGIKVIEDGAHALGSKIQNKFLGNFSDFTMFSLQAIKHITSVDGGLLICKDEEDYKRAKLLRWYGIDRNAKNVKDLRCELDIIEAGHKMHMNDVCATVGLENFRYLDEILLKHQENARYYDEVFKDKIEVAKPLKNSKSAYWLYTIHIKNRDILMEKLKEKGIMSSKVHARNDSHSIFQSFKEHLPNVDKFNDTHLCIPVGWWVTKENREYIAETILKLIS